MNQALLKLAKVDKSKYNAQTLSIIDVMACYFLDMLYNVLYLRVKELKKSEKIANITDGYKSALMVYYKGLNNNDNLTKCIENIQRTFNEQPGFSNVSFLECINNIVEQFSPKDAFDGFGDKEKRILLKKVVIDVNSAFISHILNNRLRMIIDDRKNKQSVNILKGELMDFFLLEREKIISEYLNVVLNVEKTGSISTQTAERLQQIISDTVKNMVIYKNKAKKFKEMATQYKFELDQLKGKSTPTNTGNPGNPPNFRNPGNPGNSTNIGNSVNVNKSQTSIPRPSSEQDSDDILDLSEDSDNIHISEDDENEVDKLQSEQTTNIPNQTPNNTKTPNIVNLADSNNVITTIVEDDSENLFEDNVPTAIPRITVDDLSIGDDETPMPPDSSQQEDKNEFEVELDNIVKQPTETTSKIVQPSSISTQRNVRIREDPLATESETSVVKIKKGGKLKIKKDVPVKKVQFN